MKHIACSDSGMEFLPAAKRIIVAGMTIRAVAIVRRSAWNPTLYQTGPCQYTTISKEFETLTSLFSNGVPGMGTRALTGNDSGCSDILIAMNKASWKNIEPGASLRDFPD